MFFPFSSFWRADLFAHMRVMTMCRVGSLLGLFGGTSVHIFLRSLAGMFFGKKGPFFGVFSIWSVGSEKRPEHSEQPREFLT